MAPLNAASAMPKPENSLMEQAASNHNRVISLRDRLGSIGDSLYGATPKSVGAENAIGGPQQSLHTTINFIGQALTECEEEVARIARGL